MGHIPLNCFNQSNVCPFREIDHFVGVGVHAGGVPTQLRELLTVLVQEAAKVRLGSPMCVVDDAGTISAFMQRRSDEAGLLLHLFGQAHPLIDQCLLLLRCLPYLWSVFQSCP